MNGSWHRPGPTQNVSSTYWLTAAIWSGVSSLPKAGMKPSPLVTIWMTSATPSTSNLTPIRLGRGGTPCPWSPWQREQVWE